MTTHHHSKHKDHKELSLKLQFEVDSILTNVNEKGLFSEFRDREIIDIHDISDKPIISELIDQRIHHIDSRRHQPSRVLKQTEHVSKKVNTMVNYLFKPFEL